MYKNSTPIIRLPSILYVPPLILPCHCLRPQKLLESLRSIEPSEPTLLNASMRQVRLIMNCHVVNMYRPAVNPPRDTQAPLQILREHRRRQPILGIIRQVDRLFVAIDRKE